ncbi:MAG: hypothetical protein ACRD2O_15175, partial [Terriglobia bacterium]
MGDGEELILGIDLGTDSLGWALVARREGNPQRLVRAGVRIFDSGMDETKGLGKEESRNLGRREARLHRRQLGRRRRRMEKILHLLEGYGLLPPEGVKTGDSRQDFLNALDHEILASPWFAARRAASASPEPLQTLPYLLRAAALDEEIPRYYLGRALYH